MCRYMNTSMYLFNFVYQNHFFLTCRVLVKRMKNLCYLDRVKIGVDTVRFEIDPTMAPHGNIRSKI